ncbi:MAG TPA: hypothetical protein PK869_16375 [Candidatus Hydrogenedentes bacterium]|mgnify:CR=1 FL=1|nr:hypothetical protein [Candidatus Hydrogenedentota bacterium]
MAKPNPKWNDKLRCSKAPEVKRLDKAFAGMPEGSRMLIASHAILDDYVRAIPRNQTVSVKTMRDELADRHRAEHTCPVTTGIFLRIVAEAAWERHLAGEPVEAITPFWRIIDPASLLAAKLACGVEFIAKQRKTERG